MHKNPFKCKVNFMFSKGKPHLYASKYKVFKQTNDQGVSGWVMEHFHGGHGGFSKANIHVKILQRNGV